MSPHTRDLSFDTLQLHQTGRVLTVRFAQPPLNFGTMAFVRDLDRLTSSVDRDDSVGALVLTGGLPGRFITHLDARDLGSIQNFPHPQVSMRFMEFVVPVINIVMRVPGMLWLMERVGGNLGKGLVLGHRWKRTILRMNRSRVVYIAAINGPVLDGGLEIALACDLRYTTDAAHLRLSQSEMLVGVIPGGGGSQRLLRMLGTARALEHILEGVPLTAPEALAAGLVHRVVPDDQLLTEAQATATRLARRSPIAVAALKRCMYFGLDRRFTRALDLEVAGFAASGFSRAGARALQPYLDDLDRLGDTPFLADPQPWIDGTRVDFIK